MRRDEVQKASVRTKLHVRAKPVLLLVDTMSHVSDVVGKLSPCKDIVHKCLSWSTNTDAANWNPIVGTVPYSGTLHSLFGDESVDDLAIAVLLNP